jgi:hypothetical protein
MPHFFTWTHLCLTYDGPKDIYKLYVNGEKRESGTWGGGDNSRRVAPVRSGGQTILGQDQDILGGGFQVGFSTKLVSGFSRNTKLSKHY